MPKQRDNRLVLLAHRPIHEDAHRGMSGPSSSKIARTRA